MPTMDDAFQTIAAGYRKESRKAAFDVAVSVAIGLVIVTSFTMAFVVWAVFNRSTGLGTDWETAVRDIALLGGGAFLIWTALACVILRESFRGIRKKEQDKLRYWEEHPEESCHAYTLLEYGFYELALKGFEGNLERLFEEAREREDELRRFFEEYEQMEPWVNGFPRPVPAFKNIDLWPYGYCHEMRRRCFEKLDRTAEAQIEAEKVASIKKIVEENATLTKKYWNSYYDD